MAGLFSKPETPQPVEPTVMPVPDDAATKKAKKKALERQMQTGGRASTILSTEDKLGG